jgi:hypothetical protein
MASDKQIRANRRNARKSTGPKTQQGKAAVSHNALKHGLLSRQILLPNEDEASLVQLSEHLHSQLQPVGELESLLVDRIIAAAWRLRRVLAVEAGIYEDIRGAAFRFLRSRTWPRRGLYPGRQRCQRSLQALPLRDHHRAWPLQGRARTLAPAGGPPNRKHRPVPVGRGHRRLRALHGRPLRQNGFVSQYGLTKLDVSRSAPSRERPCYRGP